MISAGDFRNGVTLEIDGNVVQILEFQHVKPGKGAAFVRTKLKKLSSTWCGRKIFPSYREIPTGSYRQSRYAVSVCRWGSVQLYEHGNL